MPAIAANSSFVAERIARYYRRDADIIHPPVHIERFPLHLDKGSDYIVVSRLVPYKRVDVVIEAFNRMPSRILVVVGTGPEESRLRAMAGPNIRFTGFASTGELVRLMGSARAFVFAAEEDFGIAMVEAMACGTPVIAFASGGSADLVIEGVTGILVPQQSSDAFVTGIERFEDSRAAFTPESIHRHAERFTAERFRFALHRAMLQTLPRTQAASGTGYHVRDGVVS
jgi:glycosyltransferase involved in cell wall biosynthesis